MTPISAPNETDAACSHVLYVLVRTDIALAQQLVQAAHAAAEAARRFYRHEHGTASLVVLAVPDGAALHRAHERLLAHGIEHEMFFEPDDAMGHSAIGTEPLCARRRRALRRYPLWGGAGRATREALPGAPPAASVL